MSSIPLDSDPRDYETEFRKLYMKYPDQLANYELKATVHKEIFKAVPNYAGLSVIRNYEDDEEQDQNEFPQLRPLVLEVAITTNPSDDSVLKVVEALNNSGSFKGCKVQHFDLIQVSDPTLNLKYQGSIARPFA